MPSSDLYVHDPHKFSNAGLQLRVPVDLVPPNQYARITNAVSVIEGQLTSRASLSFIVKTANTTSPGSGMHSLVRLNQPSVAGVGDRIAGVDTTVQTYALPAGSSATLRDSLRDGNPLSTPNFHFQNDVSAWQVIADHAGMRKYKGGPAGGVYYNLGILPPNAVAGSGASGVDAGAGNLNSTGGPGYDWLYTYVNPVTLTESNPSDLNLVPSYVGTSGAFAIPDPGFGQTSPAGTPVAILADSATESRQSVLHTTWPATTAQMQSLKLYLSFRMTNALGTTGGACYGAIEMSLDGGQTFKLITDTLHYFPGGGTLTIMPVSLPVTQDMTQFQMRYVVLGVGSTTVPQNVTVRRIRDRAGNFDLTGLLTGGGGNATIQMTSIIDTVSGINITQTATLLPLVNRQANVSGVKSSDPQATCIRLYRRGGSVTAGWAFVGQFTVGTGAGSWTVTDNVADTNLGSFVQFNNDAPITSVFTLARPLPFVWGPAFNPARLLGCGDPDRPDAVYFSNPGNADQWGVGQWVDVSAPSDQMINGCVYNTRVFAFSKEKMFEMIAGLPGGATITPFPTPCSRGLISPWGLWPRGSASCRAIYFVAKDGVYMTTGGQEQSIVDGDIKPLFPTQDGPGRSVEGYQAVDVERIEDIRLGFHNDELYFIYRGTLGDMQMLIYDQQKQRWRAGSYPVSIATIYSEEAGPASSLLMADTAGSMYTTATGTADILQASSPDIQVVIRTGAFDQGMSLNQKEYANVIFDIDPGGATALKPVVITPLLNGEAITSAAINVTGTGRQQVPLTLGDVFGFNIEFNISFPRNAAINPVLYQFDILWRQEPAALTHWEVRETSHGMPGWQHIRDAYIAYRSTTQLVLTMTYDNTTVHTYTLPSSGGLRTKTYVPYFSNKFKVAKYSFDAADVTQPFRLYVGDSEVRVKPWVTQLGYSIEKPFGAESTMATTAFEANVVAGSGPGAQ